MSRERFVLDTNVIVSAVLLPRSVPRQAFDLAFIQGIVLVSESTLDELDEVLRRPRFERYIPEDERLQFLTNFIRDTTVIEVSEIITDCRDSKDNKFLELAVSGCATCIISGDADLLVLHPFREIPIVKPQEFASQL
jgi:putative PIN family toxin of toxin-antitoxin system